MKIFFKSLAALLFLALAVWAIRSDSLPDRTGAGGAGAAPLEARMPPLGDPGWRTSAVWDDGKAESCSYEVEWARQGRRLRGDALLVLVKEPWAPDLEVKAGRERANGFEVLKLNHLRDLGTGVYGDHQMASIFARRDSGALRKIAASSAEADGISTAHMVGGRLDTRSYFDGQGDRSIDYPAGALPEDGLPMYLRGYVKGRAPSTLSVFPSLMHGAFPRLAPATYLIEKREVEGVETGTGFFPGVELRLTSGKSVLVYTFDLRPPHNLLHFEREDGTVYRLTGCEWVADQERHGRGSEARRHAP